MSSTMKRRARREISKTAFHRITPFTKTGVQLEDSPQTSLIDVPTTDVIVARVPTSMSYAMAKMLEDDLTERFRRPVLVLSDNIELCGLEGPLDRDEIETALKGLEGSADGLVKELFARPTEGDDAPPAESEGIEGEGNEGEPDEEEEERGEETRVRSDEVD